MSENNSTALRKMTAGNAVAFLEAAAEYFERRPTGGEDRAQWSNVYNAESCRKIAEFIRSQTHTQEA